MINPFQNREEEKIKQLAQTLIKQGISISMYDAMQKAKNILSVNSQKKVEEDDDFEQLKTGSNQGNNADKESVNEDSQPKNFEEDKQFEEELKDLENLNSSPQEQKDGGERLSSQDMGIKNEDITLNELMEDANIIKEDLKEAEHNPKIIEQDKEEISELKEELEELEQEKEKQIHNEKPHQ